MNLCETCKNYQGMNYSGDKVRCVKRGTKHPRAWKCVQFAKKEGC